jgi:hypothetical protein
MGRHAATTGPPLRGSLCLTAFVINGLLRGEIAAGYVRTLRGDTFNRTSGGMQSQEDAHYPPSEMLAPPHRGPQGWVPPRRGTQGLAQRSAQRSTQRSAQRSIPNNARCVCTTHPYYGLRTTYHVRRTTYDVPRTFSTSPPASSSAALHTVPRLPPCTPPSSARAGRRAACRWFARRQWRRQA